MSSLSYQPDPYYFSKYQRLITIIIVILFFQLPFFATIGVALYAVITLNSQIICIFGFVILFTLPLGKSDIYIKIIRKYLVPTAYFKKFYRIFDEEIPSDTKPLFCFHPHSVFAYCMMGNMNCGNDAMTNMRGLVSRFILNVPFTGIIFRLCGVDSIDPKNLTHMMKQGETIGILPGGFEEATLTTPDQLRIYIKNRFGFIKYALRYGYTIYPTIVFNQHKQFKTLDAFVWLRLQINKLKFPAVIFFSKWLLFLNPNFQMITVIGKGLKLDNQDKRDKKSQPTKQQINQIHKKYIAQIQRLYKRYQHLNGNSPLAIY